MEFKDIGKVIAGILIIIVSIQFLFVWFKYCDNFQDKNYNVSLCIEKMVFLIIPTEVTIVQILESFPILLIVVLFLYWKFVAPHMG
ncbi:MAG: hypothetical protein AABX83_02365 [Nanoarchaeota archaeon]